MEHNRHAVQTLDGHIGGITFSLTGHPDLISAIIRFIKSLTRFANDSKVYGGYHK